MKIAKKKISFRSKKSQVSKLTRTNDKGKRKQAVHTRKHIRLTHTAPTSTQVQTIASDNNANVAYNKGYDEAYNEGFNAGFAKGFEDGNQLGYKSQ